MNMINPNLAFTNLSLYDWSTSGVSKWIYIYTVGAFPCTRVCKGQIAGVLSLIILSLVPVSGNRIEDR